MVTRKIISTLNLCMILSCTFACTINSHQGPKNPRILRFGHDSDEQSAVHESALAIASEVEAATNGELKIQVFPAQKLGTDSAMIEMARSGELDMILPPASKLSPIVPQLGLLDLPFLIKDETTLYQILNGKVGKQMLKLLSQKDLVGVEYWNAGPKQFTSNFPINSISDFAGKKMRVMRSQVLMKEFEIMGAKPLLIDYFETRSALKDKQIDAQENPISSIYRMRFHEVQSFLTLSSHSFLVQILAISSQTFESLPIEKREILVSSIRKITLKHQEKVAQESKDALSAIRRTPIQINQLSDSARGTFMFVTRDVMYSMEEELGHEFMQMLEEELGSTPTQENPILIGLDADMSGPSSLSGLAIERGIRLAISEINGKGGIGGRPLRLIVKDNQAVSARSVANIEGLHARGNVKAIFGGLQSAIIAGSLPSIEKSGIPFMVSWATATGLTHNGLKTNPVFRLSARDDKAGPFLAQQAIKRSKKVALILENSLWGHGNEVAIVKELKRSKIDPLLVTYINSGDREMIGQVKMIEDSGAQVLIMALNPAEAKHFVLAMVDRPQRIPIIAHWGVTAGDFGKELANQLQTFDFRFFQTPGFVGNSRPKAVALGQTYLKTYGGETIVDIAAPAGVIRTYDMVMILALALSKVEQDSQLTLREALEQVNTYDGAVTIYKRPFADSSHEGFDPKLYTLGRFDKLGRIVPASE